MAHTYEVLIPSHISRTGSPMLQALYKVIREQTEAVSITQRYRGYSSCLLLYGVGAADMIVARNTQLAKGGRVIMLDQGYFGRKKVVGYLRVSVDEFHPQAYLDFGPNDPVRWNAHKIHLREDYSSKGPIILVGLGPKTHAYLGPKYDTWEKDLLGELRHRFPGKQIIYRPKPRRARPHLDCPLDDTSSIEVLLKGASLVVCRHSNVAVDAAIAGVPFECEDGAAVWLAQRPYTRANRLEFLQRLAWWQWHKGEAREAWQFLNNILERRP